MIDDYSGLQKAAILLITLGPEKASAIFQHLKEDEIESLTLEIANTRSVSPQDKESVWMNIIRCVSRSSILLRAASAMPRSSLKSSWQ